MDYSKLSNEDLIALKNGQYDKISTDGLLYLKGQEKTPTPKTEPTRPKTKGNPLGNFAQGLVHGLTGLPTEIARQGANKIRPLMGKAPLSKEDVRNMPVLSYTERQPVGISGNIGNFTGELLPALALPETKIAKVPNAVNLLATGAYQGGLIGGAESFKNKGDLSGVIPGAITGGVVAPAVPYAGKAAKETVKLLPKAGGGVAKTLGRLQPKTLERAVQPDSKALDLTPEQAQNLLMNTTERVRNDYKTLLNQKGDTVGNLLKELPEDVTYKADDLINLYDGVLNNYSLSKNPELNPAVNATSKELAKIKDLLLQQDEKAVAEALASGKEIPPAVRNPKELYDINKNISNMINWDIPGTQTKNDVLEQIYGLNAKKISDISPALKQANKEYADLMDFQKNEGIRRILNNQNNIDTASSALKNYNSTVTKGNTNRNIQDLEKILTDEGYSPFLNDIDDVNAAMDLNNIRTTGDSFWANLGTAAARPLLKAARAYNSSPLPRKIAKGSKRAREIQKTYLPEVPVTVVGTSPMLYGGISYDKGYKKM